MYGCETLQIGEAERKRLVAFEMWCYGRMINIKWMDRITNEEVLGRIGEPCGRIWGREEVRDDGAHTHWDTGDCLGDDILEWGWERIGEGVGPDKNISTK